MGKQNLNIKSTAVAEALRIEARLHCGLDGLRWVYDFQILGELSAAFLGMDLLER